MTQPSTALRIPQPCAENWAAMMPTATGRHCAACQKTVVDFTQKTDAEILAMLRQAAGGTCGRLRADQLGRPLVAPAPPPRWRAWLGAVLAVGSVLGASRAAAQSALGDYHGGPVPAAHPTGVGQAAAPPGPVQPAEPPLSSSQAEAGGPFVIRGTVIDSITHEGLPGVTILLAGTTTGTATDATGAFTLPVATGATSVQLAVRYIGYVGQQLMVPAASSQAVVVALQNDVKGMLAGEVVVCGVSKQPWPWHPRRFFNWSKYWLTRPFRS